MGFTPYYKYALGWTVDPAPNGGVRIFHSHIDAKTDEEAIEKSEKILLEQFEDLPGGSVVVASVFRGNEYVKNFCPRKK